MNFVLNTGVVLVIRPVTIDFFVLPDLAGGGVANALLVSSLSGRRDILGVRAGGDSGHELGRLLFLGIGCRNERDQQYGLRFRFELTHLLLWESVRDPNIQKRSFLCPELL